jgi:hypothetical protein
MESQEETLSARVRSFTHANQQQFGHQRADLFLVGGGTRQTDRLSFAAKDFEVAFTASHVGWIGAERTPCLFVHRRLLKFQNLAVRARLLCGLKAPQTQALRAAELNDKSLAVDFLNSDRSLGSKNASYSGSFRRLQEKARDILPVRSR